MSAVAGPPAEWVDLVATALRGREGTRSSGGDELAIRCLEPGGHKSGDKRPSATWNVALGTGQCHGCGKTWGCRDAAGLIGVDLPRTGDGSGPERQWQIRDASDNVAAIHHRIDRPDGTKDVWWSRPDGSKRLGGTRAADLPLYGSHLLVDREPGDDAPTFVVEGEPATDALLEIGLVALGTVTGAASCPSAKPLEVLRDRHVVLMPDNDDAGREHMARLGAALGGIAASVLTWSPTGLPPGGDAVEYLEMHGRNVAALLERVDFEAVVTEDAAAATEIVVDAMPFDVFMATEYPEIDEIVSGVLAAGSHTLASARPGIGKSQLATAVAVSVAAGTSTLPGLTVGRREPVLYLDGEMAPRLVKQRFALHAGMLGNVDYRDLASHLRIVSRIDMQARTGRRLPSLATPQGREWLLRQLEAFPARVVVVDTVRALMRHPKYSLNDEEGWRPCEELLAELSAADVAVSYLHHDGKGGDQLGTIAREFDPSYVLKLEPPTRSRRRGWCRFRLSETKGRMGPCLSPREYVLEPDEEGTGYVWTMLEKQTQTKAEQILDHAGRHPTATPQEIAEEIGTTNSHVRSVLSKARKTAP